MQGKGFIARMVVGLTLLTTASSVFAVMSIPYGWYLEGNVGSTNLTNKSYPGSAGTSGVGGNANLGYKFFPYLGAEVGYSMYASTKISDRFSGNKAGRDKHTSYDLAIRGTLPILTSGVELFAKAGGMHATSDVAVTNQAVANAIGLVNSNSNDVGLYMGAGISYYVMPEIAFVAQWQRAKGSDSTGTLDLYTGGISLLVD